MNRAVLALCCVWGWGGGVCTGGWGGTVCCQLEQVTQAEKGCHVTKGDRGHGKWVLQDT